METYKADRLVTVNVDVQNDFCPGGSLAVTNGDQVVAPLNKLNAYTRQHNGLVVFTGDQHPSETEHFKKWPVHCVRGTGGAALRADLIVKPGDIILDKGMGQEDGYSAHEGITRDGRTLAEIIQPVGRENVAALLGGLATDYCVLKSALDTIKLDRRNGNLRVYVAEDAVRAVNSNPNDGEKALNKMRAAGIQIIKSGEMLDGRVIEFNQ